MGYLKQHPSNLFTALSILLGLATSVLGALTNPLVLIIGIVGSVIAAVALGLSIREDIRANQEAQRKELEAQQWQQLNNFRIDLATEMAKPGWEQDWQAFSEQHKSSEQ